MLLQLSRVLADDSGNNDSFIRRFLEMRNSLDKKEATVTESERLLPTDVFDDEELLYIVRDLYAAAIDTLVSTIRWFLIMMANHRDVQIRMQKEVDAIVGRDRLPSLDDESSMPYSQAVILETMRRHTLVPLSLFHETTCDTRVGEYFIPANTMVSSVIHCHFITARNV